MKPRDLKVGQVVATSPRSKHTWLVVDVDHKSCEFTLEILERTSETFQLAAAAGFDVVGQRHGGNNLDAVWFGLHEFQAHEKACSTCAGETEVGIVGRLKHLCQEGRRMLAWWGA